GAPPKAASKPLLCGATARDGFARLTRLCRTQAIGFWRGSVAVVPAARARRTVPSPTPSLAAILRELIPCAFMRTASSRERIARGRPMGFHRFGAVSFGVVEASEYTLSDHTSLQLGHGRDDGEYQFPHGRRSIQCLLIGDELYPKNTKLLQRQDQLL